MRSLIAKKEKKNSGTMNRLKELRKPSEGHWPLVE